MALTQQARALALDSFVVIHRKMADAVTLWPLMAVVDKRSAVMLVVPLPYLWEWPLELIQRDPIVSLDELCDVQVHCLSYRLKAMVWHWRVFHIHSNFYSRLCAVVLEVFWIVNLLLRKRWKIVISFLIPLIFQCLSSRGAIKCEEELERESLQNSPSVNFINYCKYLIKFVLLIHSSLFFFLYILVVCWKKTSKNMLNKKIQRALKFSRNTNFPKLNYFFIKHC